MVFLQYISRTVYRYYTKFALLTLDIFTKRSAIFIEADFRDPKTLTNTDMRNPKTLTNGDMRDPKTITSMDMETITVIT